MKEVYIAIITLVGVLVGHFIIKQNNDRNNYLKYITGERSQWRKDIRKFTLELYNDDILKRGNYCKSLNLLKSKFEIRLNPKDEEDEGILNCFDELIRIVETPKQDEDNFNNVRQELVERITLLLKHDWHRVKVESNSFSFFPKGVYILGYLTGILFWWRILYEFINKFINKFIYSVTLCLSELSLQNNEDVFTIICVGTFILIIIGWIIVVIRIILRVVLKLSQKFLKNKSKTEKISIVINCIKALIKDFINFIKDALNIPRRVTYEEYQRIRKKNKRVPR